MSGRPSAMRPMSSRLNLLRGGAPHLNNFNFQNPCQSARATHQIEVTLHRPEDGGTARYSPSKDPILLGYETAFMSIVLGYGVRLSWSTRRQQRDSCHPVEALCRQVRRELPVFATLCNGLFIWIVGSWIMKKSCSDYALYWDITTCKVGRSYPEICLLRPAVHKPNSTRGYYAQATSGHRKSQRFGWKLKEKIV